MPRFLASIDSKDTIAKKISTEDVMRHGVLNMQTF